MEIEKSEVEELSKMITHNLRAPVARLLGLATILKRTLDNESRNNLIDKIEKSAKEFDAIIKDFSLMLQSKKGEGITTKPVSLNNKITQVLSFLQDELVELNATVSMNVSSELYIEGIDAYILSIILNLTTNSLKYRSDKAPLIRIDSFISDEKIVLSYRDNGLGIDLDQYGKRLFLPNNRFHLGTEGSGLGLYFVKKQVEEIGGTITVESEVGVGTTFIITFKKAAELIDIRY
jgi:signal transduction histidine kinase